MFRPKNGNVKEKKEADIRVVAAMSVNGGKVKLNRARGRTFADNDIKRAGFHSRIKYFFYHFVQAMDLIYEKECRRGKIGED